MTDKQDVLAFIERNEADGEAGRKIAEAAKGGVVQTEQYIRKVDALEDERLREYAREVVFGIWNEQKRDAKLDEIYHGVRRKIVSDLEMGEWPRIWNAYPIKRTVDRRVNELADWKHPRFWGEQGFPWCVSLRPGFYRPNPRLFDDSVRADIASAARTENGAQGGPARLGAIPTQSEPPIPHPRDDPT